jgi:ssDNA-binding Zn-finger/Zn-ribbon topoisomerase 1
MKQFILTAIVSIMIICLTSLGLGRSFYQEQNKQQQATKTTKDVYTCPMHPNISSDKPSKCPECKMNLVKKETAREVYTCPMHPEVTKDNPGKCPKCKMDLVKKETAKDMFTCPMHPEVTKDKPGKCPKCGMNLVKKENKKSESPQKK